MRLFTEGFEEGTGASAVTQAEGTMWFDFSASGCTIVTTTPHSGTYHLNLAAGTAIKRLATGATSTNGPGGGPASIFVRCYWRRATTLNNSQALTMTTLGGGSVPFALNTRSDGKLRLVAPSTAFSETDIAVTANTWYRVEARLKVADAPTGELEVRIYADDDTATTPLWTLGPLTGEDTYPTAAITDIGFKETVGTTSYRVDDIAINNDTDNGDGQNTYPIGPGNVSMIVPSTVIAAAWEDTATGAPGTGNINATNLAELPSAISDTAYNMEDDTLNQIDRFDFTALPAECPSTAVMKIVDVYARIGGSVGTSAGVLKIWREDGTTVTDGPAMTFPASGFKILSSAEHYALGVSTKSKADIDNFTYGYENTTLATNPKQISALWVNVEWSEEAGVPAGQPTARRIARETVGLLPGSVRRM